MDNVTFIDNVQENTTIKNGVISNQILDLAILVQLVLGYSIIILNLVSALILFFCTKMMFSVRLPAINMAISDILIGTGLLAPQIVELHDQICLSKNYYVQALYFVSVLSITLMNADRVLSLRFPFKYSTLMSRRNVNIGCLVCWIVGFLSPIADNNCQWRDLDTRSSLRWTFGLFSVIILINILGYCYVIHFSITDKRGKINKKCIKKVSLYTGCFVLCTIPFITSQLIHAFTTKPTPLLLSLKKLFARVIFLTPFLNPVLYSVLFTECRTQFIIIFCFWNTKLVNKFKQKSKEKMCTYSIPSIPKSVGRSPL